MPSTRPFVLLSFRRFVLNVRRARPQRSATRPKRGASPLFASAEEMLVAGPVAIGLPTAKRRNEYSRGRSEAPPNSFLRTRLSPRRFADSPISRLAGPQFVSSTDHGKSPLGARPLPASSPRFLGCFFASKKRRPKHLRSFPGVSAVGSTGIHHPARKPRRTLPRLAHVPRQIRLVLPSRRTPPHARRQRRQHRRNPDDFPQPHRFTSATATAARRSSSAPAPEGPPPPPKPGNSTAPSRPIR